MTSSPDQRLSPFQTRQVHAVEMQPGRHKQVSCSPPAFSPSYQGFHLRVVLHRPETFVSSCRTSLSSRVTCVAVEPISTSQTGEFTAMRPAFRMQPQEQLVPDGQIFHADRTHRNQPWESMSRLLGRPEKRNLLLSQPDNMLQAQISPVEAFSATAATEDHDTHSPFPRVVEYCVCFKASQLYGSGH